MKMINQLEKRCPDRMSKLSIRTGAFFLIAAVLTLYSQVLLAQSYPTGFSQVQVAGGINDPTVMAFTPDGRILVAEQSGALRVIKNGTLLSTPFVKLNVNSSGERGLIGIAVDPNFASNQYIYLYYTVPSSPIHNRISRFKANGDVAQAGSETVILELDNLSGATNHNGGAMQFGKDGKLYVAIGENANTQHSQNLDTYHGKMLRINADGSIPSGNPFTTGTDKRRRVWSYGLRNPFTFDIQPGTGRIFVNDVGQSSWEEINDATTGGRNFGWPNAEGFSSNSAYTNPVFAYGRGSGDGEGCAITGGAFFNPGNTSYPSSYQGKYFYLDYCSNWINMIDVSGSTAVRSSFARNIGNNSVSLSVGNDGNLYYLSRGNKSLYKIIYTLNQAPAITSHPASATITEGQPVTFSVSASGSQPLSYQWQKNGSNISGANNASYTIASVLPSDAGQYRVVVSNSAGSATSNAATLSVTAFNAAPTAKITSPADQSIYRAGDVISFSGTGTDPEDGNLPANAYDWEVIFHHDAHTHPGPAVSVSADGKSGSFEIPTEGHLDANVWYQLSLTVTDSKGLKHTNTVDVKPRVVTVSFTTNPAGLTVLVDGQPKTTPYSFETVTGVLMSLSAPSPQQLNNVSYQLAGWENGLGAGGSITAPENNTTYKANFSATSNDLREADNPVNPVNGISYAYYEGQWDQLPSFASLTPVKSGTGSAFQLSDRNSNDLFAFRFQGYVNVPADGQYTFYTRSDDGSQLYIGSQMVVNNDGLHAAEERSGTIGLKAGYHAVTVTYFEKYGEEVLGVSYAGPGLSKQSIPASALYISGGELRNPDNPANPVAQLNYNYYEGVWTSVPEFGSLTSLETGRVSTFDVSPRNQNNEYAFRFQGYVNVPTDGQYTFYTNSDDGSLLYIGSQLVVNNDGLHAMQERSGTIGLKAGYHAIQLDFFQRWGGQGLQVSYAGPGLSKQSIPASALFRDGSGSRMAVEPSLDEQSTFATQVYPNPAKENVTVRLFAESQGQVNIEIADVLSRNLAQSAHEVEAGMNDVTLSIKSLPDGLHYMIIRNGDHRVVKQLLIQK
jgi:glucose/arabinose dehydrogenase